MFVLSTVSFYKDLVEDFRDKEKSKLDIFLISSYFSVALFLALGYLLEFKLLYISCNNISAGDGEIG